MKASPGDRPTAGQAILESDDPAGVDAAAVETVEGKKETRSKESAGKSAGEEYDDMEDRW